jgi:hypothetical protein
MAESAARLLTHAPEELTRGKLRRLGEGVGKVVYASDHWVVKRERSPREVIALIAVWNLLRRLERLLPGRLGARVRNRPARQIRFLRVLTQTLILILPRTLWFASHLGGMWRAHYKRDLRGERLAQARLAGTGLVPHRVDFPPTRVRIGGWPGWLTVDHAAERVESTLYQRLAELSQARRFHEVEVWLDRFLELRKAGWRTGLFSIDAHLKNFGVSADRVVLLDTGGLTDRWPEIEKRLEELERVAEPHVRLGLGEILKLRPDIAARFNTQWKRLVNREEVQRRISKAEAPNFTKPDD